jgi:hypothetical protein
VPVDTAGVMDEASYTINATPEAFAVLSGGIYSKKIEAIVRELSCNARDSHVAAGKSDVPFEVQLPTAYDPIFRIRDFGTGMKHDVMMELYRTYFGSDKRQSNELVGALGLGSKSPFCYVDGFTVISIHDGVRTVYSAYLDDRRCPKIVSLDSKSATEPNGVTVEFPVKYGDVREFISVAGRVFEFFEPKPKFNINVNINSAEYGLKGDGWAVRSLFKSEYNQWSGPRAIMGGVIYPLDGIDESKTDVHHRLMMQMPLDLFFEIGDVDVQASREKLSLSKRTIDNVIAKLDSVYTALLDTMVSQLQSCQTTWEARLKLVQLQNGPNSALIKHAVQKGSFTAFNGLKDLKGNCEFHPTKFPATKMIRYEFKSGKYAGRHILHPTNGDAVKLQALLSSGKTHDDFKAGIEVDSNVSFWINDLKRGAMGLIRAFAIKNNTTGYIYVIHPFDKETEQAPFLLQAQSVITAIGKPEVSMASTLKTEFNVSDAQRAHKGDRPECWQYKSLFSLGRDASTFTGQWERITAEELDDALGDEPTRYYIPLHFMKPQGMNLDNATADDFGSFISELVASNLIPDLAEASQIFGLRAKSPLRSDPSWINLLDVALEALKKASLNQTLRLRVAENERANVNIQLPRVVESFQNLTSSDKQMLLKLLTYRDTVFEKLVTYDPKASQTPSTPLTSEEKSTWYLIKTYHSIIGCNIDLPKLPQNLNMAADLEKACLNTYPHWQKFMSYWMNKNEFKELISYVCLVEELNACKEELKQLRGEVATLQQAVDAGLAIA